MYPLCSEFTNTLNVLYRKLIDVVCVKCLVTKVYGCIALYNMRGILTKVLKLKSHEFLSSGRGKKSEPKFYTTSWFLR